MIGQHTSYGRVRYSLVTSAGGYLPTGYLPTGYLPTGYLPIGAAATGGGSLRGKSAAAATLSMATSPAVTIMMIFMIDRKSGVEGKRVDLGGRRIIKKRERRTLL